MVCGLSVQQGKYKALESFMVARGRELPRPEPDYPIDKMRCLLDRLIFRDRESPGRKARAQDDNPRPMAV